MIYKNFAIQMYGFDKEKSVTTAQVQFYDCNIYRIGEKEIIKIKIEGSLEDAYNKIVKDLDNNVYL